MDTSWEFGRVLDMSAMLTGFRTTRTEQILNVTVFFLLLWASQVFLQVACKEG